MLTSTSINTCLLLDELLYGEHFDRLEISKVHPIAHNATKLLKFIPIILALNDYGIKDIIEKGNGNKLPPPMAFHRSVNVEKIERRLARNSGSVC